MVRVARSSPIIERLNPPHPQAGPVAFIGICVLGLAAALRAMLGLTVGTEQWWTTVIALLIILPGFAIIIGGWLYIQREVAFGPDTIVVRRWLSTLAGRPGRTMPLDAGTRSAITLDNVRSLRLEHVGEPPIALTIGYWDPRRIGRLVEVLHARGIPLAQYWEGFYPPGTS